MIDKAYAVIGANYGDEGKGLWTDHLCAKNVSRDTLVVLCNGGSQRGHTVVYNKIYKYTDNIEHVYHHFGSGTLLGVPTYITHHFVLNPLTFRPEYEILSDKSYKIYTAYKNPIVYVDHDCMVTTPFDVIMNLIQMKHDNIHNSCGEGIWETINRYYNTEAKCNTLRIGDYKKLLEDPSNVYTNITEIMYNMVYRLKDRGLDITDEWETFFTDYEGLVTKYIEDLTFMIDHINIIEDPNEINRRILIFEMGQGLGLDKDIDPEFGTSSNTGLVNIIDTLKRFDASDTLRTTLEIYYITRSYNTRHGDGPFEEYPEDSDFAKTILDNEMTNTTNPNQGRFRVGPLNFKELKARIKKDLDHIPAELKYPEFLANDSTGYPDYIDFKLDNKKFTAEPNIVITHLDEVTDFENILDSDYIDELYSFGNELVLGRTRDKVF